MNATSPAHSPQPDSAPAQSAPKLVVASNADWHYEGVVLRTTHVKCRCGADFHNLEVFHLHTAPARIIGHATITSRLTPINDASISMHDKAVTETYRHVQVPVCSSCVGRLAAPQPIQPMTELAWRRALEKKAEARTAAARTKPEAAPRTLNDVSKLLNLGIKA